MTTKDSNDALVNQLKQSLDQQANDLDAATLSQLRQARARALDEMARKQQRFKPGIIWAGDNGIAPDMAQQIADVDLLTDDDSIDFYEDLDFYIWLEQQENDINDV